MKIASVVLVLQFIGYNSGVIVPSGVAKASNEVLLDNNSSNSEISLETKAKRFKQIDDKELYRTAAEKKYNLTERSFVIIKGRFKNHQKAHPATKQMIFSDKPYSKAQSTDQHHNNTRFIPTPRNVNRFAPLFVPNIKTRDTMQTKFAAALPKFIEPSQYQHIPETHTAKGLTSYSQPIYIYPGKILTRYANMKQASNLSREKYFENNQKENHYANKITAQPPQSSKKKLETAARLQHRLNYSYRLMSPQRESQQPVNREAGTSYKPETNTMLEIGNVSPSDPIAENESLLERFLNKFNQDIITINNTFYQTSESPKLCKKCKHMANSKNKSTNCNKCSKNNKDNAHHFYSTNKKTNPTISSYDYDSDEVKAMID